MLESNTNPNFHNKNETPSCPEPSVPGRINSSAKIDLDHHNALDLFFFGRCKGFFDKRYKGA